MEIGEEQEPVEVPVPVHPDDVPTEDPKPQPSRPSLTGCPHEHPEARIYDLALQEAVAVVTTFRDAAHGGQAHSLRIETDTKLFVHVLGVIAVLALAEVDHLGGDGDALLREIGIKAAGRLA